MKFVIFGATGPTGQELTEACLGQGHSVVALVRSPEKLTVQHDNLSVQKVEITQEDDIASHMKDSDAVFSCLGSRASIWAPVSIYTDSIHSIAGAMKKAGVRRFVGISSWGTKYDPGLPFVIRWVLRPLFLRQVLANMSAMEDFLEEKCPEIDYTVVRPPQLTNNPSSGKEILTADGQYVPGGGNAISRHDVAHFMLACVVKGEWKKKFVAVTVK